MIRKHKKFSKPRKAYDLKRIQDENKIVAKYGLKNKREIWKAKAKLDIIRNTAKKMIYSDEETQEKFIAKLKKEGFGISRPVDVLALTEEDILKRRLQTVLINKKFATTAKAARQMITHRHVTINGKIVDIPSYMVDIDEENKIKLVKIKFIVTKKAGEKMKKIDKIEDIEENKLADIPLEVAEIENG